MQNVTVQGQVKQFNGTPISSALVKLLAVGHIYEGTSDASGNYQITDVREGRYPVIVTHPSYTFWQKELVIQPEGPQTIQFDVTAEKRTLR